jgi:hypothetical protein
VLRGARSPGHRVSAFRISGPQKSRWPPLWAGGSEVRGQKRTRARFSGYPIQDLVLGKGERAKRPWLLDTNLHLGATTY